MVTMRTFGLAAALIGGVGYRLVVGGELTLDTGLGRRIRPLGPLTFAIAAPRETVFDVIAARPIWGGRHGRWQRRSRC